MAPRRFFPFLLLLLSVVFFAGCADTIAPAAPERGANNAITSESQPNDISSSVDTGEEPDAHNRSTSDTTKEPGTRGRRDDDDSGEHLADRDAGDPNSDRDDDADAPLPDRNADAEDPLPDKDGTYTSKDDVALYLRTYGELPQNFITKKEAKKLGWEGGSLEPYAPGKCIGGDHFGNYEGLLPEDDDYRECDIDTLGKKSRGAKRIIYSDDGDIYYTEDHYKSFTTLLED
ncbi:MAG: hypothetical protein IJT32_05280 [Lachnospiraceae bacterium]|nr:hypothetical protein [Lachnospiraceae bacterium]